MLIALEKTEYENLIGHYFPSLCILHCLWKLVSILAIKLVLYLFILSCVAKLISKLNALRLIRILLTINLDEALPQGVYYLHKNIPLFGYVVFLPIPICKGLSVHCRRVSPFLPILGGMRIPLGGIYRFVLSVCPISHDRVFSSQISQLLSLTCNQSPSLGHLQYASSISSNCKSPIAWSFGLQQVIWFFLFLFLLLLIWSWIWL